MADAVAGTAGLRAEQALLGALLIDADAWLEIDDRFSPAWFEDARHAEIASAMLALRAAQKAVDAVTVGDRIGQLGYVGQLARDTPTAANVATYRDLVREAANRRRLRRLFAEASNVLDTDPRRSAEDVVARALQRLQDVQASTRSGRGLIDAATLARDLIDDLDSRADGKRGLAIGLPDFDSLTGGLEPGDLVVIAGRPGMGKTALLVSVAAAVAQRAPVAVFSAEMPARQLMRRALAQRSGISQSKLRRPEQLTDADFAAIASATAPLGDLQLWIDDTPLPTLAHVRAECAAARAKHGLALVLVDYLQLVAGTGATRYEQLREVAYGLKALAKDIKAPVIALAQLNRGVEAREEKRASVSDMRDSGAIEEAADIVGLLYSESFYNPEFPMPYALECRIGKNRNGERGECLWQFDGARSCISLLDAGAAIEYRRLRAQASSHKRGRHDDL